jgi:uncharacterized protein (TIGR02145 family)
MNILLNKNIIFKLILVFLVLGGFFFFSENAKAACFSTTEGGYSVCTNIPDPPTVSGNRVTFYFSTDLGMDPAAGGMIEVSPVSDFSSGVQDACYTSAYFSGGGPNGYCDTSRCYLHTWEFDSCDVPNGTWYWRFRYFDDGIGTDYGAGEDNAGMFTVGSSGSGLSNITWDNLTTGGSGTAVGTTTWSIIGLALQSGQNNITITATDNTGNSTSTQMTVDYTGAGFTCGDNISYNGDVYSTVQMSSAYGGKCWFGENLRTTKKPDGSNIITGVYCDPAGCGTGWGRLYEWDTAMNGASTAAGCGVQIQGICPAGWHIPSDYAGCSGDDFPSLGTNAGALKKTGTTEWNTTNAGVTNASNFTAYPAGRHYTDGNYYSRGIYGYFWSSSENISLPTNAWARFLHDNDATFQKTWYIKPEAFSIRCVQDSATPPGIGGNVNGWAWSAGTGWINFSASNPLAMAPNTRHIASAVETSVKKAADTVSRIAKFFRLNFNHSLAASKQKIKSVRYVNSFIDSIRLTVKIALAQAADFGVSIAADGQFSGYAWSDAVGWIYFGPNATLTDYGLTEDTAAPADPKTWAKWNKPAVGNDTITGWAKILALGDDGWIQMSSSTNTAWTGKGVGLLANGDFTGWAWNAGAGGKAGIGWISFNAQVCDTNGNGFIDTDAMVDGCGGQDNASTPLENFKVTTNIGAANQTPTIDNLSAPNWSYADAAGPQGAKRARLAWDFHDGDNDAQGGFQIIINTSNSTSTPVPVINETVVSGSSQYLTNALAWNTPYYWWVRAWDIKGATSTWAQYSSATDTDNNDCLLTPPAPDCTNTFTTYKHLFPSAKFTWEPVNPSKDQNVNFIDQSLVVTSVGGEYETASTTNGTVWAWVFDNGDPANSTDPNPIAKFTAVGNTTVTMKVTDSDGYYSSTSTIFDKIKFKLPSWTEQKP